MGQLCTCPRGSALGDVDDVLCEESIGQIQKGAFQRTFNSTGVKNSIADPALLASWTALLAAADDTKVVVTPYISSPEMEPGAARTYGGGNETIDGIERVIGREPTSFTSKLENVPQKVVKQLKTFACETVSVWYFDENGAIQCIVDDIDTPTEYYGVPVAPKTMFVGDLKNGGLDAADDNAFTWMHKPNWSDNRAIVIPADFNPLTDLKNE